MTMPSERTRALRWGWEFLNELELAGDFDAEWMARIQKILGGYPSSQEIKVWATKTPYMAPEEYPEDAETFANENRKRSPVTISQQSRQNG